MSDTYEYCRDNPKEVRSLGKELLVAISRQEDACLDLSRFKDDHEGNVKADLIEDVVDVLNDEDFIGHEVCDGSEFVCAGSRDGAARHAWTIRSSDVLEPVYRD